MLDNAAEYAMPPTRKGVATGIQLLWRGNAGKSLLKGPCASVDRAYEVETLTETYLIEPRWVLARDQAGSFVAMSRHWTTHTRARHMALLLRNGHGLLRARCHLWVATGARVPLARVLRLLLLAMELWRERGSLLAMLLLHVWRVALVGTGGLHHVRAGAWRSIESVGTRSLLRHVRHLGLRVWRHRRVSLVLWRHESTRGWILSHHRRTCSHLRHVRTAKAGTRGEAGTHLVHFEIC